MHVSVKRSDKLVGYPKVPVQVSVRFYQGAPEGRVELAKEILNGQSIDFDFDASSFDVGFSVSGVTLKEHIGLCPKEDLSLQFGLKESDKPSLSGVKSIKELAAENFARAEEERLKMIADRRHHSQVINYDKLGIALVILLLLCFPIVSGLAVSIESDSVLLSWLLGGALVVCFLVSMFFVMESGAGVSRCKKCNSTMIRFVKENEKYEGTYSRQEHVLDRNTGETIWRQVIKSDFGVTEYYCCDLCQHRWTNSYTRTTKAD